MPAQLRSGLKVDSTLKEVSGGTNSQPVSTDSENHDKEGLSGNIHPKFVKALSQVPYSPLYGVLWPSIIEQASFETRDLLRQVNIYFETSCHPYRRSDLAKRSYASHYGNREKRKGLPFVLDLSFGVEWRCWGANRCSFNSIETFRAFCAAGDIDPDQWRRWDPRDYLTRNDPGFYRYRYVWMSRTKSVVFETQLNPLGRSGYCGRVDLTGVADKAIAMYNFIHDNHVEESNESDDEPATQTTRWIDLMWKRGC